MCKHTWSFKEPLQQYIGSIGEGSRGVYFSYFSNSLHIITCCRISSGAQGLPLGPKYVCQKPQLAFPHHLEQVLHSPPPSKSMLCLHLFRHSLIYPSSPPINTDFSLSLVISFLMLGQAKSPTLFILISPRYECSKDECRWIRRTDRWSNGQHSVTLVNVLSLTV